MGFGLNANAPVLNLNPDQQTVKHVQLPRARRVEVRVVDVNGVGMAGVEVIPTSLAGRAVEINDHGRRRTDSNGYILRGGFAPLPTDYMITALATETVRRTSQGNGLFLAETQFTHCPARALVRLTDPNVTTQVKIVMRKIKTLRGANMSPSGNGITFNQTEGDFSLGAAGPGIYQVQAAADGYAPCWSDPINSDENQATLISLSQGCMLTGRIINQSGDPVNNARVIPLSWASDPHPRTQLLFASEKGAALTADGLFTLSHIPAGMESLKIMHAHYAPKTVRDIDITAGQITDIDDIVLSSGGSIEGFVLDEQDNPLANQPLVFCDAMTGTTNVTSQRWATVVTDANGFYAVHHLPTQLCYVYQDKLWRMRGVISRAVTPKAGETVRLDFGGAFKVRGIIEAQNEVLPQRRVTLRLDFNLSSPISPRRMTGSILNSTSQWTWTASVPCKPASYVQAPTGPRGPIPRSPMNTWCLTCLEPCPRRPSTNSERCSSLWPALETGSHSGPWKSPETTDGSTRSNANRSNSS